MDASGRHRPGSAVHLKEVDATTIAGRQIHVGWQHMAERRTEGSDIGEEWPVGFSRLRLEQAIYEGCCHYKGDRGFQKQTSGTVGWNHGENSLCGCEYGWSKWYQWLRNTHSARMNQSDAQFCCDTILSYPRGGGRSRSECLKTHSGIKSTNA